VPVSMMLPPKVSRSTIAAQSRGSVKVFVQPENDSLDAMARLFFDQPAASHRSPTHRGRACGPPTAAAPAPVAAPTATLCAPSADAPDAGPKAPGSTTPPGDDPAGSPQTAPPSTPLPALPADVLTTTMGVGPVKRDVSSPGESRWGHPNLLLHAQVGPPKAATLTAP
jgi:hypothetical protein